MTLKEKIKEVLHEEVLSFENQDYFWKSQEKTADKIILLFLESLPKEETEKKESFTFTQQTMGCPSFKVYPLTEKQTGFNDALSEIKSLIKEEK